MIYIKNAAEAPCTRRAESRTLSNNYSQQSAIQRKAPSKKLKIKIICAHPCKREDVSTNHNNNK